MSTELEGFDKLKNELDELKNELEQLDGTNEVPLGELLTDRFMRKFTDFSTVEDFFEASPWTVESEEDFDAIPAEDFDRYVAKRTTFPEWEEMLGKAGEQYVVRQLGI